MTIARDLVDRALAAAYDTRQLILEAGALGSVVDVLSAPFGDRPGVVVADPTTWAVAGRRVDELLRRAGRVVRAPVLLPAGVRADFDRVVELERTLGADGAVPIAVGSGTINDLTKLAAHRLGRPYAVVATAASMDGYAAFGASITRDGFKQTFPCPAPAAIVADPEILAAAPTPLTAAGYGDLLGKVTAGADWLVADALEVEPVDADAWSLVQESLPAALRDPERLRRHDVAATERFFLGLVISGLAMQATRTSRPASGDEHLLSHLWEMLGLTHAGAAPSHGAKVGVGTVLVTILYEQLLAHDLTAIDIEARVAAHPASDAVERAVRAAHPAGEVADRAVVESLTKHPAPDELRARLTLLRDRWPSLRRRLRAQLLPPAQLRRRLRALGAASTPGEIGLTPERLRGDLLGARTIRRRYTVLDLASEAGLLEPCVDAVIDQLIHDDGQASLGAGEPRR
jgi:glycerol-1-phosphate dehydrogenase [NAD(P)+]